MMKLRILYQEIRSEGCTCLLFLLCKFHCNLHMMKLRIFNFWQYKAQISEAKSHSYLSFAIGNILLWTTLWTTLDTMDYPCIVCRQEVRQRQEALECEGCLQWQHRTCGTGISRDDYRAAVRERRPLDFTCQGCQNPPPALDIPEPGKHAFFVTEI